jgi:UDP-2,4-diacetamido-2,4,6-trideoxy-beta-L-altropyranose hydrolase
MNAFVLTEGGLNIGFGHITRCLSLCQAFEANGILPEFIVNGDESIDGVFKDRQHKRLNWLEHEKRVLASIKDADIVIIDSYLADIDFYREVSGSVRVAVFIDDNKRVDYPKGVVVNGSISAERLHYPARENIAYLLGPKYIPLRKEFWNTPEKEIRDNVTSIMVTFGGDDMRNLTPKVMELLAKDYPGLSRQIVIGKGFRNPKQIEAAADHNTILHHNPDAETMLNIMLSSDVAISACGQTLYELARVGVPAIAVAVADNQFNNASGWRQAGFIEYAGWWEDGMLLDNVRSALRLLEDGDGRKKMSRNGRTEVDGKGANRVVDYLCNKESVCKIV